MLRANFEKTGKKYSSWEIKDYNFILKNRNGFKCGYCKSDVIFVDGIEIIKHFRHKVTSTCDFEPESQEHYEMKYFMRDFMGLTNDDLEVDFGFGRADLYDKQKNIAFEVQKSNITKKKFLERCYNYTKNGIAVMWIFHDSFLKLADEKQNIPILLRTAQEHGFERVYLYSNKKLFSVRFNSLCRWVDEYEDYQSGYVYGGYLKEYKRKKSITVIQEIPDEVYGKKIFFCRTKWNHNTPSGYLMAKFYDI